jgi:GDP-L-fucose synthase
MVLVVFQICTLRGVDNLGSGEEVSMRELVALIARLTGFQGRIVWDPSKPNGQRRRLEAMGTGCAFGFQAKTALETGLVNTVAWYREQVAKTD